MKRFNIVTLISLCILFRHSMQGISQDNTKLSPEILKFNREKMTFKDDQVLLFNGRGFASPREFSMTGFTNVIFAPIYLETYDFFINFIEESTKTVIRDDVPHFWKKHIERKPGGCDPLAGNFRSYAPKMIVTQDEVWQPNLDTKTGTFHKEIDNKWITFAVTTQMCVSSVKDEVIFSVEIKNRDKEELNLTLQPNHVADALPVQDNPLSGNIVKNTPFIKASEALRVTAASDIKERNDEGFRVSIPANSSKKFYFAVEFTTTDTQEPELYQTDIKERFAAAQVKTKESFDWAAERLPSFECENKDMNELYRRAILSVLMCRYERDNFIIKPFWAVGTWLSTISWDNSYASDILAMLEPESLKSTLNLNFENGQMKRTYIGYKGATWDMLYIQEPFAQQLMIDAYLNQYGDLSILTQKAGDASVYEWMKRWVYELHDNYSNKDGLMDVGYSTEKIIEIRTDGYNHVVPIVNLLTLDLYKRVVYWGNLLGDKEVTKFDKWADDLYEKIYANLWNEEIGWFENIYKDGSKDAIWTYHLFDVLASKNVPNGVKAKLASHIKDGVFLGEYGFYSIARTDSVHWDRIDGDWGGGGQYAGMPTRIARNLYRNGNSELGWDILTRFAKYTHNFPYFTQNASTDKAIQEQSSMPLQISAGSGAEAVIYGIFGINTTYNGELTITPSYHRDMGNAKLSNFNYRGNKYDITINEKSFKVYKNGVMEAEIVIGNSYKENL